MMTDDYINIWLEYELYIYIDYTAQFYCVFLLLNMPAYRGEEFTVVF